MSVETDQTGNMNYTTDFCNKCGEEFPVKDLVLVACEGIFCESCELDLLERACSE